MPTNRVRTRTPSSQSSNILDRLFVHCAQTGVCSHRSCNHASSPGSDSIRYSTLAHLGIKSNEGLLSYFNAYVTSCTVPVSWRTALILILKLSKSPRDISSYRPIALSSCIGKRMERMV